MASGGYGPVLRQLGRLLGGGGTAAGLGEGQLLRRFADHRDEAAFEVLVTRHGPMVLATCRRMLPVPQDVEDAFQATFLVLARRAGSIRDPERLGPWLHGVARRVAARSRALAARREAREQPGAEDRAATEADPAEAVELRSALDEELARLPEKYRAPLVLCYLEGLTHDQAALQLSWPVGTVRTRLAGGRQRLRASLTRRGLSPSAAAPAVLPAAAIPRALISSTIRIATAAGATPARVASLAKGALVAMMWEKMKLIAAVGLMAAIVVGGAGAFARQVVEGRSAGPLTAREPAEERPDDKSGSPPPRPGSYPLTVTGRAVDTAGRPIPGARIYLASCRYDDHRRLAETRTDQAGFYRFDAVPLPIGPASIPGFADGGVFEVFGQAAGFGLAWRPSKRIDPSREIPPAIVPIDPPDAYKPGDAIGLDLTFPPPSKITGRVVDDRGRPLRARLDISHCEKDNPDQPFMPTVFDAFAASATIPAEIRRTETDADGNFAFDGLPRDHRFQIDVRPRDFPWRRILAMTTDLPQPDHDGLAVFSGELRVTFETPREVPFRVLTGDTAQPAAKAAVSVGRLGGGDHITNLDTTDAEGRVSLRLPPGEYRLSLLPAYGTPYLVREDRFVVDAADGPVKPVEATLEAACVLEVTVVDAETGEGISDVDLWEEAGPDSTGRAPGSRDLLSFRSWEVAGRIVHSDRPRTDAGGKLRALIGPGRHRIGVGLRSRPGGREVVDPEGRVIEGQPGETLKLKFSMRRRS
jgi:RNA polymerase sigma factor (sigma-70 family)